MYGLLLLSGGAIGGIALGAILVIIIIYAICVAVRDRRMRSKYKKLKRKVTAKEEKKGISALFKKSPTISQAVKLFGKCSKVKGDEYTWTWRSLKCGGMKMKIVAVAGDNEKINSLNLIEPRTKKPAKPKRKKESKTIDDDFLKYYEDGVIPSHSVAHEDAEEEMTADEFFRVRKIADSAVTGVYVLYNKTKNMYYVGQSGNVFNRVYNHLTGKGHGDVYADYKYGDEFSVKILALSDSGMKSLDDLERYMIEKYNSFSSGYNKTRGNGKSES
ncbi:MAG: GIY-YIG nuclease family protein [Clostridia bacterium]|nr:GIY-YIG nuclease family protein [Clostridia bacterium]